jgi:hypothetical protein
VKAHTIKLQMIGPARLTAICALLIFVANLAAAYLAFAPLDFSMPDYGLDPSWRAVLGEALAHHWIFGRDIIFTGGPLSPILTRDFQSDFLPYYFAIDAILIATFAFLVTVLAAKKCKLAAGLLPALGLPLSLLHGPDPILIAFPLLVSFTTLSTDRGATQRTAIGLGLLCCSVLTLAKFLIVPVAIVSFVLADIVCLFVRRRWPVHTAGYVLFCFAVFAWFQGASSFPSYIAGSFSVASGYSSAMYLTGSRVELITFLAGIALLLGTIGMSELGAVMHGDTTKPIALVRWLIIAAYLFTAFKEGFVRHDDQHSPLAWSALGLAACLYPVALGAAKRGTSGVCVIVAALAMLVAAPAFYRGPLVILRGIAPRIERQGVLAINFVSRPEKQIEAWRREKEAASARVRAAQKMPHLDGSVDVIPSLQSSLLAYGLDYRPRYTIQEYTTYTRSLIEANRRSLTQNGSDYLMYQPESIDERYPAMAEGPLWPYILAAYEPMSLQDDLLVLRRRPQVLNNILQAEVSHTATLDDVITLPDSNLPQFLTAKIEETPLGRLVDFLFRPSPVVMTVVYVDGSQRSYRVIPAIAEAGFFISPSVVSAADFLMLASGETDPLPRVKEIRFKTSKLGQYLYNSNVDISLSSLSIDVLKQTRRQ